MINRAKNIFRIGQFGAWLMLGLVLYLSISNLVSTNILYTDDAAFSIGLAKTILHGEVLLQGVPSHLGGRHLGPWYNYLVALCLFLSGNDLTWTFRLLALVNLAGFGLAGWLAFGIAPLSSKWWAVIGLCFVLIGAQYIWLIRVPWISNYLLVPGALTFALSWLVISKGPRYLTPFICGATLCLQTHLASAPMLIGLAVVTGLSTLTKGRQEKWRDTWTDHRHWHVAWLAVFVALWIPLLIYEIRVSDNITRLFLVHTKVVSVHAGFIDALSLLGQFLRFFLLGDSSLEVLFSPLPGVVGYLLLSAAVVLWFRHLIRTSAQVRWLWFAISAGLLLTLICVARLSPPIHAYYFNGFVGAVACWAGIVFAEAVYAIFFEHHKSFLFQSCSFLVIVLAGLALARSGKRNFDLYSNQPFPQIATLEHATQVASIIEADRLGEQKVAIFVRGRQALRAGAFYSLLKGNYFPSMMYANKCIELSSVRAYNLLNVKNRKSDAAIAYVMHCPAVADISTRKYWRKMSKWWAIDRNVSLTECTTCSECSLTRLKRSGA